MNIAVRRRAARLMALIVSVPVVWSAAGWAQPQPADLELARATLARAREGYLGLKSYRDTTHVAYAWKARDYPAQSSEFEVANTFAAPRSMAAVSGNDMLISDGSSVYRVDKRGRRYVQEPLPEPFDPRECTEGLAVGEWLASPTITILTRGDKNPETLLRVVETLTGARHEERGGEPGTVVTATGRMGPDENRSGPVTVAMFFRARDGLLAFLEVDATGASNAAAEEGVEWEYARYTYTFKGIEVNPDTPPTAFQVPEGHKKVESLEEDPSMGRVSQEALIGEPAPDFEGEGLDGQPVRLKELRGRVVVLDFWATWCGPCVAAIPHMQELNERYAGKAVTVLGINHDRGDKDRVSKFVADKGLTFRHLMDDGTVGQEYLVTGIPSTVLIDADGVVQHVSMGFRPGDEDGLAARIDTLLEGKPLRTPEELAALKAKRAEEEATRTDLAFESFEGDSLSVNRFTARGYFSRHQTWLMNIDGDPGNELINPGHEADIEIVDAAGEKVRRIRFSGLGMGQILSAATIDINGERHWLVGHLGMLPGAQRIAIGLFTDAGAEVWVHYPDLPEGTFCQCQVAAGDLTGDGRPEMVAGISAIRQGGQGLEFGPGNQVGAVIVLSATGERLAQRGMGAVDLVFVGKPAAAGTPGKLLIGSGGRLQRVDFKLPPARAADEDPKP